jgi:phosphotriesterase-related protein
MTRTMAFKAGWVSGLVGLLVSLHPAIRLAGQTAALLPPIPDMSGKILTVAGPMEPSALGQTLMHEHIFIDFQDPKPKSSLAANISADRPSLSLQTLSATRSRRIGSARDSQALGDFEEMRAEVLEFKKWGGQAIADMSNIGLGRDPQALWQMSNATGLAIVMGAGWYYKDYHPLDMDRRTVEQLSDRIVRDIVVGVDGTNIRSGIIGEVGITGNPLTENEVKSVRASARASRLTGAPISFHVGGYREEKFRVLDVIASEGVDLSRVVMGHSWSAARGEDNLAFNRRLLERGVFIEVDYLGVIQAGAGVLGGRNDRAVAQGVMEMIRAGYGDRILVGHDICNKLQLKKYGGTGFSYISEYFLPELRHLGATDVDIQRIMIENPRHALTFVAPRPLVGTH